MLTMTTSVRTTVGVPKEIKTAEHRVAMTPDGIREMERLGIEVFVETGAGEGASISDADYLAAGATIVPTAADAWGQSMVVKVKEPKAEAGYSYNDMRYTKTSGLKGSFIAGDRLARTPQNTANLSFFYTLPTGLLKGISFGAIGNYIGNRLGGWNNQIVISSGGVVTVNDREIPLNDYTTIDLSAGYTWKNFSILCKLSNVTNELNYTVHENYSVNPIAPRQVMTSLKYKF